MFMDVSEWLNNFAKINELIGGKNAEKKQLKESRDFFKAMALDISPKLSDGMPFNNNGTVSKKVEKGVVNMVSLDEGIEDIEAAINQYMRERNEIILAIEKLPRNEYGVIHRHYIRGMTIEAIAEDMGYSTVQIWRIKKKGLKNLKNVIDCNDYKEI